MVAILEADGVHIGGSKCPKNFHNGRVTLRQTVLVWKLLKTVFSEIYLIVLWAERVEQLCWNVVRSAELSTSLALVPSQITYWLMNSYLWILRKQKNKLESHNEPVILFLVATRKKQTSSLLKIASVIINLR